MVGGAGGVAGGMYDVLCVDGGEDIVVVSGCMEDGFLAGGEFWVKGVNLMVENIMR